MKLFDIVICENWDATLKKSFTGWVRDQFWCSHYPIVRQFHILNQPHGLNSQTNMTHIVESHDVFTVHKKVDHSMVIWLWCHTDPNIFALAKKREWYFCLMYDILFIQGFGWLLPPLGYFFKNVNNPKLLWFSKVFNTCPVLFGTTFWPFNQNLLTPTPHFWWIIKSLPLG